MRQANEQETMGFTALRGELRDQVEVRPAKVDSPNSSVERNWWLAKVGMYVQPNTTLDTIVPSWWVSMRGDGQKVRVRLTYDSVVPQLWQLLVSTFNDEGAE